MKKLLLLLIILLNSSICLAAEKIDIHLGHDYIMTSAKKVKNIYVSRPEVLNISGFVTIFNEKTTFLIHPKAQGKSNIMIVWEDLTKTYEVNVKSKSSQKPPEYINTLFEIIPIDTPPKGKKIKEQNDFELDAPPMIKLEVE